MHLLCLLALLSPLAEGISVERRRQIVQEFNVRRSASSDTTPLQVGNGNFAFGADITGLQTFKPYAILSTWGWHNFSLPTTPGQTSPEDFTGLDWWTHDRLVNYEQPNPAQPEISNWLRENPHRINLARIGFDFGPGSFQVTEDDLQNKTQELDMWAGILTSSFRYNDTSVQVLTAVDPDLDSIAITIDSALLRTGLGIFFDFPYPTKDKFNAPFVGVFNETSKHSTILEQSSPHAAQITHILDSTTYYANLAWSGPDATISRLAASSHRYILAASPESHSHNLNLTITFSPTPSTFTSSPSTSSILASSALFWSKLFATSSFIDLLSVPFPQARTLQRRIIQSLYLTTLNSASALPPQESGLVNNGWHGKFHLEMTLWHLLPFARFNLFPLFSRSLPRTYEKFLESSKERAKKQGYKGARWGKMTSPEGKSAPGEINALLIWQQPGPLYLAEMEYRHAVHLEGEKEEEVARVVAAVLKKWDRIIHETAEFMADFPYLNQSTGLYDLGPPMYSVSENTNPNVTRNAVFELAFWGFGLDVAIEWKARQNQTVPVSWIEVKDKLAALPVQNGTYVSYEGIEGMWTRQETTFDHPGMAGIYGLLPGHVDKEVMKRTADKVRENWRLEESYGWDFAMLAMNELRLGRPDRAVEYLLHPVFAFDDAGYPVGGSRVPTPYFPNSASLLVAVAMMAGGWDGSEGMKGHWPAGWEEFVEVEGFEPAL
ncbi:Six-hairpin glycosidase-like protein [Cladorrhinum sp. PSN259]|nr:Six-hairpin glycosidase-like protein [Cladorrhinum sp. PSN259]